MTTEEHLNRIVAKCRDNLELAAKRTHGKWDSGKGNSRSAAITGYSFYAKVISENTWYSQAKDDAEFIAACAGSAESGWRATIAAIEGLTKASRVVDQHADALCSQSYARLNLEQIIAAWPEDLL